jgi:hypothetical protein
LEPLKGRSVLADPDEFDATETLGRVGAQAEVVDGLENRGPGCDTNTGTDEDSNFVLKDILSGGSVGSVNLETGHLLAVLERNLVHAHGVKFIVQLRLRLSSTKSIGKSAGEVTDLADVDGDIWVVGARSNRKWMPLVVADFRAVEEEPLSWLVPHARLLELNLDGVYFELARYFYPGCEKLTIWVAHDLDNLGLASAADLTVEAIAEVKTTAYKLPSPTLVTNAVSPEAFLVEWRERCSSVTNEAAGCVCVHAEQERNEEVVGVPKGLEGLLSDPVVRSGVDQQHAEQHDMSCNATSLGVMDLECDLWADLGTLDVEKAAFISTKQAGRIGIDLLDIMRRDVENGEEQHSVGDLSVEPHGFIERRPPHLGSEPSENVPAHGHNDNHGVD